MSKVYVNVVDASCKVQVDGILTAGAVGIPVEVHISGERWEGIAPMLITECDGVAVRSVIAGGQTVVPQECLIAGRTISFGVDGRNDDGTIRIPTVWALQAGVVRGSTAEADQKEPIVPTPDIVSQIVNMSSVAYWRSDEVYNAYQSGGLKGEQGPAGPVGPQGEPGKGVDPAEINAIKQAQTEIKDDLSQLDNTKVGYSEVVNGQLLMYSDSTKAHLLATLDLGIPGDWEVVLDTTLEEPASEVRVNTDSHGNPLSGRKLNGIKVLSFFAVDETKTVPTGFRLNGGAIYQRWVSTAITAGRDNAFSYETTISRLSGLNVFTCIMNQAAMSNIQGLSGSNQNAQICQSWGSKNDKVSDISCGFMQNNLMGVGTRIIIAVR